MKLQYPVIALALLLASCAGKDRMQSGGSETVLSLGKVGVDVSKAVIEGNAYPDADAVSLGVFLTASSGEVYPGGPYVNVEFTKESGSQRWTGADAVALTETLGAIYAYYPYDESVSDMTVIPVQSSLDGDDYMHAVPVTGVNSSRAEVDLEMKHALALICLNLTRGEGYPGACLLTSVSLSGEGIAASGIMDASDGSINAEPSEFTVSGIEHSFSNGLSENLLVVPAVVSSDRQKVKMGLTIDGEEKEVTFDSAKGLIVKQGAKFEVNITVSGTGLKLSGVSVTAWNGDCMIDSDLGKEGIVVTGADAGQYGGTIQF